MSYKSNKTSFRIIFILALFVVVCLIYAIRMVNIVANADPNERIDTETYTRREPIQVLRGEIFDRNGKVLVYNKYTYDMVFDYDAMAASQLERNYAILNAANAIELMSKQESRTDSSFPFDGIYPNYTYSAEARDGNSNVYYRLLKRIAQNELEYDSSMSKTELTVTGLDAFYKESPDAFPSELEIIDFYMTKYSLGEVDFDGTPLFTDEEIDKIIRVR